MDPRVLAAIGVVPELPAAQAAAQLVRRIPLRFHAAASARDPDTVIESRWFAGPAECARVLGRLFRGATARGSAFGSPWPFLEAAGVVVAPALPLAVDSDEQQGPDGAYRLAKGVVWREAIGERQPLLATRGGPPAKQAGSFDLLWFGDSERYLLRAGMVEVEDLFSRLSAPASRELVERLVLRGLRVEALALEGLSFAARKAPPEIEVRRPTGPIPEKLWRDPGAVLSRRVDIRRVERRGDELSAETARDTTVVFRLVEEPRGWKLFTWDGEFPFRGLALAERDGHLRFSATLGPELDPFEPGVRGRVVFDLRSDLVALAKKQERR